MTRKISRGGNRTGHAGARGRYRAFRRDDVRSQLEQRLWALGLGTAPLPANGLEPLLTRHLARALRRERRAARAGGWGYDPLRHLVLVRLARLMKRPGASRRAITARPGEKIAGSVPRR